MRSLLSLALAVFSLSFFCLVTPFAEAQSTPVSSRAPGHSLVRISTPAFDEQGQPAGLTQTLKVASAPKLKVASAPVRILPLPIKGALDSKAQVKSLDSVRVAKAVKAEELPVDPPIQMLICPNEAEVKVLANEISYGAGGPQVPTRLSYELNGVVTQMFGGQNVTPGGQQIIALQAGQELKFWGHSAYPDFDAPYPWVNYLVPSDDAVNAAILINGDNFFTMSLAKGMQSPFGMQQSIQTILANNNLAGAIDWNTGLVTLDTNEVIILFELGASSPASPAFDFNDLVLHVRTPCPVEQPYDLRNNIPGVQPANLRVQAMENTQSALDSNAAINFIGDGRLLNFVEVYFVIRRLDGTPNGLNSSAMDFKLSGRYSGTSTYFTSPLNSTEPADWTQVFLTPANSDWATPIYMSGVYHVYKAQFFIPNMLTVSGQEHTITFNGFGNTSASGIILLLFSNNTGGSFGASSDWRWAQGAGNPSSLTSAGAPFPTVAARVGFVPLP